MTRFVVEWTKWELVDKFTNFFGSLQPARTNLIPGYYSKYTVRKPDDLG